MLKCWEIAPETRPTFSLLVRSLSKFLENIAGYMDVSNLKEMKCLDESNSIFLKKDNNKETICN